MKACVPLAAEQSEAFQFDWSEEGVVVGGMPALAGLAHEAMRDPGVLAGGVLRPKPRNAVRRAHWIALSGVARRGIYTPCCKRASATLELDL